MRRIGPDATRPDAGGRHLASSIAAIDGPVGPIGPYRGGPSGPNGRFEPAWTLVSVSLKPKEEVNGFAGNLFPLGIHPHLDAQLSGHRGDDRPVRGGADRALPSRR